MIPKQEEEASQMARIPRMVITGEPTVYHIISRTALDGFVLGDVEKEFLLNLIKRLSSVYFAEVLGFCIMGTHLHLLCRMHPGDGFTDEEIRKRFSLRETTPGHCRPPGHLFVEAPFGIDPQRPITGHRFLY
jgi:hypothetical protein